MGVNLIEEAEKLAEKRRGRLARAYEVLSTVKEAGRKLLREWGSEADVISYRHRL